ncbi:hypothetical protein [Paraburkholderia sacchari]|uniref:hypothetical protein n=1 Tax=Paraburkholderia sacchari TaxID=159450 RepID=UPI0039A5FB40
MGLSARAAGCARANALAGLEHGDLDAERAPLATFMPITPAPTMAIRFTLRNASASARPSSSVLGLAQRPRG